MDEIHEHLSHQAIHLTLGRWQAIIHPWDRNDTFFGMINAGEWQSSRVHKARKFATLANARKAAIRYLRKMAAEDAAYRHNPSFKLRHHSVGGRKGTSRTREVQRQIYADSPAAILEEVYPGHKARRAAAGLRRATRGKKNPDLATAQRDARTMARDFGRSANVYQTLGGDFRALMPGERAPST